MNTTTTTASATEQQCRRCRKQVPEAEAVRKPHISTGKPIYFHDDCWTAVEREREETAQRDREQSIRIALQDVDRAFTNCSGRVTELFEKTLSNMPRWDWARFDNQRFRQLASSRIVEAAEAWRPKHGNLILMGPTGCGKTAACVALVHAARDRAIAAINGGNPGAKMPELRFLDGPHLAVARRQHDLGKGEAPAVQLAMAASFLILDEVGFESMIDTVIFDIADCRHKEARITILTTGRTEQEFIDRYGDACWRRFSEAANVVADFPDGRH